jgi:hypothetical protein
MQEVPNTPKAEDRSVKEMNISVARMFEWGRKYGWTAEIAVGVFRRKDGHSMAG